MEQHYTNFFTILYKLISDYNRYIPNEGSQKILEVYKELDKAKVIFRIYHLLKDNLNKIINKDDSLFQNKFIILPEIDFSENWNKLSSAQKNKIFTYFHILSIESDLLVNSDKNKKESNEVNETNNVKKEESTTEEKTNALKFNPYEGIGGCDANYSVEEIVSSLSKYEDETPMGPGLETIANMIGLNKLINLEELTDQLKNMKKEDIDAATTNIKNLLGDKLDEKTSELISEMLSEVSDELKKSDMNKKDPLKNIYNIAEVVANKMKPKVVNEKIDLSNLLNTTKNVSSQFKDENGNPIFNDSNNPLNLLSKLTSSFNSSNPSESLQKECNDMLKGLGMNNLNLNDISKHFSKNNMPQKKKMHKKFPKK